MIRLPLFAALAIAPILAHAQIQTTIDPNEYFAYSSWSGGKNVLLLSHQACGDASKSKEGWRKASYRFPATGRVTTNCWKSVPMDRDGFDMNVCEMSQDGTLGKYCQEVKKSIFTDTSSLPRRPNF